MRFGRSIGAAVVLGLLGQAALAAGPTLTDDFESGSLSRWQQNTAVAQNRLEVLAAAAHRGDAGFRLTDVATSGTDAPQNYLARDLVGITGAYHVRFWFRMSDLAAGTPGFTITQLQLPSNSVIAALSINADTGRIGLQGTTFSGDYTSSVGQQEMDDGQWRLVELSLNGLGGANGYRRLWVDGLQQVESGNLNYASATFVPEQVKIGIPFAGNGGFTGTLEFDDFRSGPTRWANLFVFDAPPAIAQGVCLEATLRASMRDLQVSPANLTEDTRVEVSAADGGVDFFSDVTCATPASSVLVRSGTASARVWFKSRGEGTQLLVAAHPDYLRNETTIQTEAPKAVAGVTPGTLPEGGGTVTLSSTGSAPSTGFTLTKLRWRIVAGPTGVTIPASGPLDVQLTVPGKYTFELVVEDSAGGVSKPAYAIVEVAGEIRRVEGPVPGCSQAGGSVLCFGLGALATLLQRRGSRARAWARGTCGGARVT